MLTSSLPGRLMLMAILAGCMLAPAYGQQPDWERIADLRGSWLFTIGDDERWADPALDDASWDRIFVPARWEDEGFGGYDGTAWYRRHINVPDDLPDQALYLHLGRIDDVDEVYLNGHLLGGTGSWPPTYKTAFNVFRIYRISADYLMPGQDNVIAVRVYDAGGEGGILEGRVGIYIDRAEPRRVIDLAGPWQFRPGDDPRWRDSYGDKDGWTNVNVPGFWEAQGFADYDGYAWYRKQFFVPKEAVAEDLVLLLGKIDDMDEVFLNGIKIGGTGDIESREINSTDYQVIRVYPVPRELLRRGRYNSLAVRVYDGYIDGGIYEGPIGIVTRAEAERWRRLNPKAGSKENFWDSWFNFFNNVGEHERE